jgi:hypothetical protein
MPAQNFFVIISNYLLQNLIEMTVVPIDQAHRCYFSLFIYLFKLMGYTEQKTASNSCMLHLWKVLKGEVYQMYLPCKDEVFP